MPRITILLFVWLGIFSLLSATAGEYSITGIQIPLLEGMRILESKSNQQTHIDTFIVDKPLEVVVNFYEAYLNEQGFLVIGGREKDIFQVSVKKDASMFTLRISKDRFGTIVQFIW